MTRTRQLSRSPLAALAIGILLGITVPAPAAATSITFSQFVSGPAEPAAQAAGLPAASPAVANWGWSGPLPGGYTPAAYAYAFDVLSAIQAVSTLPTRSTSLLIATGDSAQPGRAVWLLNPYAPAPRIDDAFLARELQSAIWNSLYDGSDAPLTTGATAARTVRFLSALYRLPVGDPSESWHALLRNDNVVSRRADPDLPAVELAANALTAHAPHRRYAIRDGCHCNPSPIMRSISLAYVTPARWADSAKSSPCASCGFGLASITNSCPSAFIRRSMRA